jgi:hypothetical protein
MARWSALLDAGTNVVLTISPSLSSIIFVQQCTLDTVRVNSVDYPHYRSSFIHQEPFFLARRPSHEYPQWVWNRAERKLYPNKAEELTPGLIARSELATAKCTAVQEIMRLVSRARLSIWTGVDFQDRVEMTRRFQAQRFKDAGYVEDMISDFPFVLQYADVIGKTVSEAADDILFKAKLDDEILLQTELLRLTYFEKARRAETPKQLTEILDEFSKETRSSPLA